MKNLGKVNAIIISAVLAFITLAGLILSFVPMSFGSKDYESFAGAQSLSTTIDGGMSVEYEIKSESTDAQIASSIKILTDIISEYGYKSVTAYKKGDNKIRVDLNQPVLVSERSSTEDFLTNLASGRMQFKNKNDASATLTPKEGEEVDPTLIIIEMSQHVDSITKVNYQQSSGVQINFNKEGKKLYAQATGSPLYMFVDNEAWPNSNGNEISANTDASATSMYLIFNSSDVVDSYYYVLKAGTMSIELDKDTVEIFYNKNHNALVAKVAGIVLVAVVCVGLIVLAIIKSRGFVVAPLVSSIISLALLLFLTQAMNWVAMGLASILTIAVLQVLVFALNANIYNSIKKEYAIGKSLSTAVSDAYRKNLWVVIDSMAITFILGLVVAIISGGELMGVGTILALGAVLLTFSTLLLNRVILNCIYSFNEKSETFFGLTKREEETHENNI